MGAGYTIEPLWGNRLAHFKGQKGACLSKESPLFTFIAEMQPRSAVKSLTMSHAHKNTLKHTLLHKLKQYIETTDIAACTNMQIHMNIRARTHKLSRTKTDLKYMPRCFTAGCYLYSVVNSNYHRVFYFLCTFPCCSRSEWICWVKAFSLFNAVADSENAPARIL